MLPVPSRVQDTGRAEPTPREPRSRGAHVPLPTRLLRLWCGVQGAQRVMPARRERAVQHPPVQPEDAGLPWRPDEQYEEAGHLRTSQSPCVSLSASPSTTVIKPILRFSHVCNNNNSNAFTIFIRTIRHCREARRSWTSSYSRQARCHGSHLVCNSSLLLDKTIPRMRLLHSFLFFSNPDLFPSRTATQYGYVRYCRTSITLLLCMKHWHSQPTPDTPVGCRPNQFERNGISIKLCLTSAQGAELLKHIHCRIMPRD